MLLNRLIRIFALLSVFTCVLPAFAQDASNDEVTMRLPFKPRIAIKAEPLDFFIGSFNTELEVWLSPTISLVMPVFYAHHDAALLKNSLFWNSSLGVNLGFKFHMNGPYSGIYLAPEGGVFVVYPFESGSRHLFGGNSVYSEIQKSPMALPVGVFRVGYDWIFESGFMIDCSAGLIMYGQFPWALTRLQIGWAF